MAAELLAELALAAPHDQPPVGAARAPAKLTVKRRKAGEKLAKKAEGTLLDLGFKILDT